MSHISDDIFLGPVLTGHGQAAGGPSPSELGVGPMGRIYTFDVVPLVLQLAGLAALQQTAGAGNLVLTAGTGVTARVRSDGVTEYVLDTPRCVTISSAGAFGAVTFTVSGYDLYGKAMTQTLAGPANSTVSTLKAFKTVTSIHTSAALGTDTRAGYGDVLGLPVRVTDAGYIVRVGWDGALGADAGTFVAAVTTSPSTAALGDVRGTYLPSSATDGAKRLIVAIAVPGIACGPNATRVGALGVDQV